MKTIVMHFCKVSPTSTIASGRIAKYIQNFLDCELIDTKEKAEAFLKYQLAYHKNEPFISFTVNSPFGFCDWRDEALQICKAAKDLIWVQNDYNIKPPSQFSKAGIVIDTGHCWTTCKGKGQYIDWNKLTFNEELYNYTGAHNINGLFYHGAFRKGRIGDFEKYFKDTDYNVTISTTPKNAKNFRECCGSVNLLSPLKSMKPLTRFKAALYIEDKKSHTDFHSLANRFYEYFSAGLAILFDSKCEHTLEKSGLQNYKDFLVSDKQDIYNLLDEWETIVTTQRKYWFRDYLDDLDIKFEELYDTREKYIWDKL